MARKWNSIDIKHTEIRNALYAASYKDDAEKYGVDREKQKIQLIGVGIGIGIGIEMSSIWKSTIPIPIPTPTPISLRIPWLIL